MTKIQVLSNTNYQLENVIKSELMEATDTRIAVAFLKKSGIAKVQKALDFSLIQNNANMEIIVGLDFKTTDYEALIELQNLKSKYSNFRFYCFGDKKDNYNSLVFHPKIYLFNNEKKYTAVVGSSNFTGGGLSTNFEVNTVFQESNKDTKYFSQVEAIYKEIKFQDSIFIPNDDYLEKYIQTKKEIDKNTQKALKSKEIQQEIKKLAKEAENLEGTIPSLKKIVIEYIKLNNNQPIELSSIYEYCSNYVATNGLQHKFKSKDFNATVRGELNKHELLSKHKDSMALFERIGNGLYRLSQNGLNYDRR